MSSQYTLFRNGRAVTTHKTIEDAKREASRDHADHRNRPERHIYQIVDANNVILFTVQREQGKRLKWQEGAGS